MPTLESASPDHPRLYRVRFRGTLDASWFAALRDLSISSIRHGRMTETTVVGEAPDEAALIGLINMLYQLGHRLISVESIDQDALVDHQDNPST